MPDNLKKKKLDRQRVNLTQKHEVRNLKRNAEAILVRLQNINESGCLLQRLPPKISCSINHKENLQGPAEVFEMIVKGWNPDNPGNMEATLDEGEQALIKEAFDLTLPGDKIQSLGLAVVARCIKCGCTEEDCSQCIEKDGTPCNWVAPCKCSSCFDENGKPK